MFMFQSASLHKVFGRFKPWQHLGCAFWFCQQRREWFISGLVSAVVRAGTMLVHCRRTGCLNLFHGAKLQNSIRCSVCPQFLSLSKVNVDINIPYLVNSIESMKAPLFWGPSGSMHQPWRVSSLCLPQGLDLVGAWWYSFNLLISFNIFWPLARLHMFVRFTSIAYGSYGIWWESLDDKNQTKANIACDQRMPKQPTPRLDLWFSS